MTTTALSKEMLKNFVQLEKDEQQSVLQVVKIFLKKKNNNQAPQSIEAYNNELKAAMKGAKRGEITSIEQLEEEMKLW